MFSVKAMSKVFRGRFIALLKEKLPAEMHRELLNELYKKDWVVYAKRPFGGTKQVIEYLGRYTHKVWVSNHRLKNIPDDKVSFSYKDYKHAGIKKK